MSMSLSMSLSIYIAHYRTVLQYRPAPRSAKQSAMISIHSPVTAMKRNDCRNHIALGRHIVRYCIAYCLMCVFICVHSIRSFSCMSEKVICHRSLHAVSRNQLSSDNVSHTSR